ncbi:MAG: DUF262 domain-containing protein [Verrucomicrobia bacterium]|nr:DUF262 domain-containing protein [Verrucomicrobiota bacterium]
MQLQSDFGERTINELILIFRSDQINLEPGFQRNSVWIKRDRRRLIQSIASSYPVPCIFLYKREHRGRLIYDVIDGKQRLETIFMFARIGRFKRQAFDTRLDLGEGIEWCDWRDICRNHHEVRSAFLGYKISTVEVTGDLAQIIDLFVRINSTGKPLTSGEKRHAKFYNSPFLAKAQSLVAQNRKYFVRHRILTPNQLDRMKGTELVSELLMSIHQGGIINKKTSLDRAIGNESINGNTLNSLASEFAKTLKALRRMFPNIQETRFHNTADFYSLFMLVWEMRDKGFVLTDRKRNSIAERLLRKLSSGVDELRTLMKEGRPPRQIQPLYRDYLLTVQGDTDSAASRHRRAELLRTLLVSVFDFKDGQRIFTSEQRRLIWNSEERRICSICRRPLKWEDFSVDHIIAWIKGGKTTINNAQIAHRRCNSRKGGR